jgi:hypothetical protein
MSTQRHRRAKRRLADEPDEAREEPPLRKGEDFVRTDVAATLG